MGPDRSLETAPEHCTSRGGSLGRGGQAPKGSCSRASGPPPPWETATPGLTAWWPDLLSHQISFLAKEWSAPVPGAEGDPGSWASLQPWKRGGMSASLQMRELGLREVKTVSKVTSVGAGI